MVDEHYARPELAELYDLDSPWSPDRDFYLSLAGEMPISILDLGCGTGLLCDAYAARGHRVVGVDPAPAMLEIARRKPHGKKGEWVCSSAQDFRTDRRFDLIVMTGNAYQALLTEQDALDTLLTMARHLAPDGRAVFETRNPDLDWTSMLFGDLKLEANGQTVIEERRFVRMEGPIMQFQMNYRFSDRTVSTTSRIRFWNRDEIEAMAAQARLTTTKLHGDWDGEAFDPRRSHSMVFMLTCTG